MEKSGQVNNENWDRYIKLIYFNVWCMLWVQRYPHLWFLPCNSGNFHATCLKCYDFVNKVASYVYARKCWLSDTNMCNSLNIHKAPWVFMDPHVGNVHSSIDTMGPFRPMTYRRGLFISTLGPFEPMTFRRGLFTNSLGPFGPMTYSKGLLLLKHHGPLQTHNIYMESFRWRKAKD